MYEYERCIANVGLTRSPSPLYPLPITPLCYKMTLLLKKLLFPASIFLILFFFVCKKASLLTLIYFNICREPHTNTKSLFLSVSTPSLYLYLCVCVIHSLTLPVCSRVVSQRSDENCTWTLSLSQSKTLDLDTRILD